MSDAWLDATKWDDQGLVPAVYRSRSRGKLRHKGEESGHQQLVKSMRVDCDADLVLQEVEQKGGIACDNGRPNCFFRELQGEDWLCVAPVLKDRKQIYG